MKLIEWRRNAEVNTGNRPMNVVEQIAPYLGRDDAFISMVDVPKVGIPPRTEHTGTPTGIYTYPLSEPEICDQFKAIAIDPTERTVPILPYKHYAPYVALILAEKNERWFTNSASEAECDELGYFLDAIMEKVITPEQWQTAKIAALKNDYAYDFPASHFYNHVWMGASILNQRQKTDAETWNALDPYTHYKQFMHTLDYRRPLVWNSLWRKLGIEVIADYGSKMIYNQEPYQVCFLTKSAINNYSIYRNGSKSSLRGHKNVIQSAGHLFRLIYDGKLKPNEAFSFLDAISRGEQVGVGHDHDSSYSAYNENIRLTRTQARECIEFMKRQHGPWVENLLMRYRRLAEFAGFSDRRS